MLIPTNADVIYSSPTHASWSANAVGCQQHTCSPLDPKCPDNATTTGSCMPRFCAPRRCPKSGDDPAVYTTVQSVPSRSLRDCLLTHQRSICQAAHSAGTQAWQRLVCPVSPESPGEGSWQRTAPRLWSCQKQLSFSPADTSDGSRDATQSYYVHSFDSLVASV
jgi:hypothetical protein